MRNLKSLIISLILLGLFFQNTLQEIIPLFQYLDEVLAIACIFLFLFDSINYKKIKKIDLLIMVLMTLTVIVGIFGGIVSELTPTLFWQFVDILSIFKFSFVILYLNNKNSIFTSKIDKKVIFKIVVPVLRTYLLILLFFCIENIFRDIGMNYGYRFGLRSFSFIYGTPGLIINQMTYSLIIFTIARIRQNKGNIGWEQIVTLIIILSTLRFRGFVLAFIYIVLFIFKHRTNKRKRRSYVLPLIVSTVIAIILGKSQFSMYFLESNTPRQRFVLGALQLAKEYFPLGSGFGTFGSSVAADNYSLVYYQLGFNHYYGMSYQQPLFLNDNYFPMILGQLGYLGTCLFIIFLFLVIKEFLVGYMHSKFLLLSIFVTVDILFSSIQSSYLAHYSVVALLFIFMSLSKNEVLKDDY